MNRLWTHIENTHCFGETGTKNHLFLFFHFMTAEGTLSARKGHLPTTSAAWASNSVFCLPVKSIVTSALYVRTPHLIWVRTSGFSKAGGYNDKEISYLALNYRKQWSLVRYGVQEHLLETSECFSKRFIF